MLLNGWLVVASRSESRNSSSSFEQQRACAHVSLNVVGNKRDRLRIPSEVLRVVSVEGGNRCG